MGTDEELLTRHLRYESPEDGISEEFHQLSLGLGRTIAVLTRPLRQASSLAWVICHSYGMEQLHLARHDAIVARAMGAAGFPVLRFHGQGYGDSDLGMDVVGLGSHLAEGLDAVEWMGGQDGVERVGVMGARFGGTVAALIAARRQLPCLTVWEPVVRGSQYIREILRSRGLAEIAGGKGGDVATEIEHERRDLVERGWTDIKGFPLTKAAYDEISAVDLTRDVDRWTGAALVVGASRTGKASPSVARLAQHLESIGARCDLEIITDRFAAQFGSFRYQTIDGGMAKRDTQLALNGSMALATVAWALRQAERPAEEVRG